MAKTHFLKKIKITYNAPVTLTFAIVSAAVLIANHFTKGTLIPAIFTAPGGSGSLTPFDIKNPLDYFRLFFHIFGHADWNHFLSNMAFILLLGPVIEEKYGSGILAVMMSVTSLVTGVLNACFSPTMLVGSSDIAFMMILLASFTSITKNEIPLSFLLILALYLGRELFGHPLNQNIATLAHIAGGICGSLFAFLATPKQRTKKEKPAEKSTERTVKSKKPTTDDESTVIGSIEL